MTRKNVGLSVLILIVAVIAAYFLFSSDVVQRADNLSASSTGLGIHAADSTSAQKGEIKESTDVPPEITGGKLDVDTAGDSDVVRVRPTVKGRNNADMTFVYEWTKNGQPAGGSDSISGFRRGDKLTVKITPFDGKLYGLSRTFSTEVSNTTPRISEIKKITANEDSLTYQVIASDADGDTLSYSLVEAPKGMTVDQNGIIRWSFEKEDYGKTVMAKVKVSDGHGGETVGSINFQIGAK